MRSIPSASRLARQASARRRARPSVTHRPARPCHAALGRHDDGPAVAGPRAQRLGDQPLVVPHLRRVASVRVGGVEQTDSSIEGGMDHRDGSPVVAIGRGREAHAAHPDARQTGDLTRHVGRHRTEGAVRQSRHNRRMIVTSRLRPGYLLAWPLDRKLTLWLASLAALAAFNVGCGSAMDALRGAALTLRRRSSSCCPGMTDGTAAALGPRVDRAHVCGQWLSGIMLEAVPRGLASHAGCGGLSSDSSSLTWAAANPAWSTISSLAA